MPERYTEIVNDALMALRVALAGTEYEEKVFLVGGFVRDKLLGKPADAADIDLVLEGDALELAEVLWKKRAASHAPVTFPAFGTAMIHVGDSQVELVTARAETYRQGSRKPVVTPGTLLTDAQRRDFTVNTFLENLHTGEILDPLGVGREHLEAKLLKTPLDPDITFTDDPLRMLRACRFAAKLGFTLHPETEAALQKNAFRLSAEHGISFERIRDELNKTLLAPGAADGLERMCVAGLLEKFAPELSGMHGVTQNGWHAFDVWTHTLEALKNLPASAELCVRLATLFHDVGKPGAKTVDAEGNVHFYEHETLGAEIAREVLRRLRYSDDESRRVVALVGLHMRYGAYQPGVWTDPAVRRLVRAVGEHRRDLFTIARADIAACGVPDVPTADLAGLSERMEFLEAAYGIVAAVSPLRGEELMARLDLKPGPILKTLKAALTDAVVAGELAPDDKTGAEALAWRVLRGDGTPVAHVQ
jgi:poly(A) polymerase